MKNLKKLTALFIVAATMFTFASCSKDNNNVCSTPTIEEQIIGRWAIPQNVGDSNGRVMEIKINHKMKIIATTLDWTHDGKVLHGIYDAYNQVIDVELTIVNVNEASMTLTGAYKYHRA